jgi:membrane fusion protein (multidrug efflux system)
VVVPEEALVPVGTKQFVFKVVTGADGKPASQRIEAKLGLRLPGQVEILEGVKAGDQLVTAGHGRLMRSDSVPVRVIDLAQAGGGKGGKPSGPGKPGGAGGAGEASGASPAGGPPAAASGAKPAAQP